MYPCPGGCGRSNDTGSWCGLCTWVIPRDMTAGLWCQPDLAKLRAQPWPFDWGKPATAWFAP